MLYEFQNIKAIFFSEFWNWSPKAGKHRICYKQAETRFFISLTSSLLESYCDNFEIICLSDFDFILPYYNQKIEFR